MAVTIGTNDNEVNIDLEQGKSMTFNFTVKDALGAVVNLTGYDVRMKAKTRYGTSTAIFDFNLSEGHFTIPTPTNGIMVLAILPTDSSTIRIPGDDDSIELVYDIEVISPSAVVSSPAWGIITVKREVTN